MSRIETKVCSKCHEEKELNLDNFGKLSRSKDGFNGRCRACMKKYKSDYYSKNKEEINKKNRDYYHDNKERMKDSMSQYYQENKEELLSYQKQYYQNNKDKIKEYDKQYNLENKDKILTYHKMYRKSEHGKEVVRRYNNSIEGKLKNHNKTNKRRIRLINSENTLTSEELDSNISYFNNRCAYCECLFSEDNKMHLEHIVPVSKGGGTTKENIVPACATCNLSKGANFLGHWYIQQSFYSLDNLVKVTNIINNFKPWIVKAQEE